MERLAPFDISIFRRRRQSAKHRGIEIPRAGTVAAMAKFLAIGQRKAKPDRELPVCHGARNLV
jgi:hypothetical protein